MFDLMLSSTAQRRRRPRQCETLFSILYACLTSEAERYTNIVAGLQAVSNLLTRHVVDPVLIYCHDILGIDRPDDPNSPSVHC